MGFFGIRLKRKPDVNYFPENTGTYAYQPYNGLPLVAYTGRTGFNTGDFLAYQPGFIVPGPSHKLNDPTVTGNVNFGLTTVPLSQPDVTANLLQNRLTQL